MDDATGADAKPFQSDRHCQCDTYLEREFRERTISSIDVAATDGMADFHERQQHGEQDRGSLHRAQRRIVAAAAHELTCNPE